MITLVLFITALFLIEKVVPFLIRLLFTLLSFFIELLVFFALFSAIGIIGIVAFFFIDLIVILLIIKVIL